MKTVFNTNRRLKSAGRVASSEYAIVTVGGRSELGQSVQGTYSRQIQTLHELGNPGVLWVPGFESGTLNFRRLVGKNGFFAGWTGTACGVLNPVSIDLGGGPCVSVASGGLRFEDAIIQSFEFQLNAQQVEITEGVSLMIGAMARG